MYKIYKKFDIDKLLNLYNQGLSNKPIAKIMGTSHEYVSTNLRKLGLSANPPKSKSSLIRIGETKAQCKKCKEIKDIINFEQFIKNNRSFIRTYCKSCKGKAHTEWKHRDISNYFKYILSRLRGHAKERLKEFNLDLEYLNYIYDSQNGKCFYTDKKLEWGKEYNDITGLSIDRIDSTKGYIKGNIVMTCKRINTIKNDLTLLELEQYIPLWHTRIKEKTFE